MDIYCQQCEEPYEAYYVQHEMTDQEKQDFLNGEHCPCCKGKPKKAEKSNKSIAQMIVNNLLKDDLDGVASTMDDFEFAGLLD